MAIMNKDEIDDDDDDDDDTGSSRCHPEGFALKVSRVTNDRKFSVQ